MQPPFEARFLWQIHALFASDSAAFHAASDAMTPPRASTTNKATSVTENDLSVAKDIGSLQADMRTVKHDVAGISQKLEGISSQISNLNVKQEKGLSFVAGIIASGTAAISFLIWIGSMVFGGKA